jgi:hypothetical protein
MCGMRHDTWTGMRSYSEQDIAFGKALDNYNWTYYCTLTTRYSLSLKHSRNLATNFLELLQSYDKSMMAFWVSEPFDTKYGNHLHALISCNAPVDAIFIRKKWAESSKGKYRIDNPNTMIAPYCKGEGANLYVAKYLKNANTDYDFVLPKL